MTKENRIKWAIVTILCLLVFFGLISEKGQNERIKKSHSVYCGTIISINWGKGGYAIIYHFVVDGKVIEPNGSCTKYTANRFQNGSKGILVVTEKGNPKVYHLLESSKDFEKFHISLSDTLGLSCLHEEY